MEPDDTLERRRRAEARRARVVLKKASAGGQEPDPWPVRGEEAISLVTRLTEESWALSGRPRPSYSRAETPWRFLRGRLT